MREPNSICSGPYYISPTVNGAHGVHHPRRAVGADRDTNPTSVLGFLVGAGPLVDAEVGAGTDTIAADQPGRAVSTNRDVCATPGKWNPRAIPRKWDRAIYRLGTRDIVRLQSCDSFVVDRIHERGGRLALMIQPNHVANLMQGDQEDVNRRWVAVNRVVIPFHETDSSVTRPESAKGVA